MLTANTDATTINTDFFIERQTPENLKVGGKSDAKPTGQKSNSDRLNPIRDPQIFNRNLANLVIIMVVDVHLSLP